MNVVEKSRAEINQKSIELQLNSYVLLVPLYVPSFFPHTFSLGPFRISTIVSKIEYLSLVKNTGKLMQKIKSETPRNSV